MNLFTSGPNHGVFVVNATPRISTAVSPDKTNGFYGGIKAHITSVLQPVIEHRPAADEGILTDRHEFYSDGVVAGIFFGLDRLQPGSGEGFQIEAMITPFHFPSFTSAPGILTQEVPSLWVIQ